MIRGTGIVIERREAFTRSMQDKPFTQQPSFHRGKTKVLQENNKPKKSVLLSRPRGNTNTKKIRIHRILRSKFMPKRLTCNDF